MANVVYTCTGCIPIDKAIIEVYVELIKLNEGVAAAEAARQIAYEAAEGTQGGSVAGDGSRWGSYKEAEELRNESFSIDEGSVSSEVGDASRWGKYKGAEAVRQEDFQNAQAERQNSYVGEEGTLNGSFPDDGSRWGEYKEAEAVRDNKFNTSQSLRNDSYRAAEGTSASPAGENSRWGKYKAAENARNDARLAAEGSPSSQPNDGTRWGAYKAAEQERSAEMENKADKDLDAVSGNVAMFDSHGNPVDGGTPLSTIVTGAMYGATAYQKPASGIPKEDLASAVRDSLSKADFAYQKPLNGIPASDMTEAVQSSLDKADTAVQDLTPITNLIPAEATTQNQLADKDFVNSSISSNTSNFLGTYNLVTDLGLTISATEQQVAAALASHVSGTPHNNDYAFVQIPTADDTPTEIARIDRYKYNGTSWLFEYSVNNSSFTAAQWAAINSGITSSLVTAFSAKYDKPSDGIPKTDLASGVQDSLGAADTAYQKPVGGIPASDIASGVIPDVSGKADKSEMSVVDGSGADADKTTITLKTGTSATVLKTHQDISGKQDVIADLSDIRSGAAAGATAYQKPNGGIPSTDMSDAVRTSLGKADSAVQDVSGKEDKINKVTTISGSSTDTEYPSAKAVNDAIKAGSVSEALRLKTEVKANQSFVFRKSAKTIGTDSLTLDKIKGRTLAWNQLGSTTGSNNAFSNADVDTGNNLYLTIQYLSSPYEALYYNNIEAGSTNIYISTIFTANRTANVVVKHNGVTADLPISEPFPVIEGHKYIASFFFATTNPTVAGGISGVLRYITDLTLLFGAGNEPSTVAEFESMFPKPYYPYNPGELISNDAKALETVGLNLWDEEWEVDLGNRVRSKNFTPVFQNTAYYFKMPNTGAAIDCYDANHNPIYTFYDVLNDIFTTPNGTAFIKIVCGAGYGATYQNDICINLSDPAKNGTYEPYKRVVLPLNLADLEVISPNIWDEEWENGKYDANDGSDVVGPDDIRSKNYIPVRGGASYCALYSGTLTLCYFDASKTFISGVLFNARGGGIFTPPANAAYMKFSTTYTYTYGSTYANDICINESNPGWNGRYYPHGTFKPFPDGLKSAGNIFDEVRGNKVIRRVGTVDLGSLEWAKNENNVFYSNDTIVSQIKPTADTDIIANLICSKFITVPWETALAQNNGIGFYDAVDSLIIYDTSMATLTPEQFAAAMSGVMLNYEQDVPEEFDLVTPLPLSTFSGTTERRLPEDTENDVMAPFDCDMTYGTNNEQMLDAMNAKAVSISKDTLLTLLNALKSGSVIADYSITWGDNGPELVITPNS